MIRWRLIRETARTRPQHVILLLLMAAAACARPIAPRPDVPPGAERQPRDLPALDPRVRALVQQGAVLWKRPPSPENTIACATCHVEADELRGWAASFPKVKPMRPPFTRVMTLQQAVAESVVTHYRISSSRELQRAARAIAAYLAWAGEGRPLTPGVAAGQPVFPTRLAALWESVSRGRNHVDRACRGCHADPAAVAEAAATFPRVAAGQRVVSTLEEYLERHAGLSWSGSEAADVVAFLAHLARGQILRPGEASKIPRPRRDCREAGGAEGSIPLPLP